MKNDIRNRLMIAQLSISAWTAKKYDKNATKAVEATYHTHKNVGRFHKEIVDNKELKEIYKLCSAMRIFHVENTLPWGDHGERLFPIANYHTYKEKMTEYITQFKEEVRKFAVKYPSLKEEARQKLNALFNENDYPADITQKFDVRISYFPLPDTEDIRIDLPTSDVKNIKTNLQNTVDARLDDAVRDIWVRIELVIGKLIERLSDPDNKFKNSLIDNINDLIELAPKLNVFHNPDLDKVCNKMRDLLVDPEILRNNPELRNLTVDKANKIITEVKTFAAQGARLIEV